MAAADRSIGQLARLILGVVALVALAPLVAILMQLHRALKERYDE